MDFSEFRESRTMACLKGLSATVGAAHSAKPEIFNDDRLAILVATTGCIGGIVMKELGKGDQIDTTASQFTSAVDDVISEAQQGISDSLPEGWGNFIFGPPGLVINK